MGVYFAEGQGSGLIKIGLSLSPQKMLGRVASLRSEAIRAFGVSDVVLIGCWPMANLADERSLHTVFDGCRHRGEWFRATAALREHIADAYPVVLPLAFQSLSWAEYAAAIGHPPLCEDWLDEEMAQALKVRAPLKVWPGRSRAGQHP